MQNIQEYLTNNLSTYLDTLRQMVNTNSFTANANGVNRLGEFSAAKFSELGFSTEAIQSENLHYGKHILMTHPGRSAKKIALISHLDTVFPPEEELSNDFTWRIEGDRAYGPGTVDIKGGTVMMLMVLSALKRFYPGIFETITWIVGLDASEEVLSNDFGRLLLERLDLQTLACLVFEGGTPVNQKAAMVVARKGKANFKIQVVGRSAHSGNRHAQGANAILQISHTIQQVAGLTDYNRQLTFNVGTLRGGSVVNRVPHYAEAEVEMRTFSPQVFQEGVNSIMTLNGKSQVSSQDGFPCKVEIIQLEQTAPWPRNPQTDRLFELWKSVGHEIRLSIIPEERGGLSDGNLLWEHLPTLDGLGPIGNNAHCSERTEDRSKDQEFVLISSFVPKAILNILAIARLASQ